AGPHGPAHGISVGSADDSAKWLQQTRCFNVDLWAQGRDIPAEETEDFFPPLIGHQTQAHFPLSIRRHQGFYTRPLVPANKSVNLERGQCPDAAEVLLRIGGAQRLKAVGPHETVYVEARRQKLLDLRLRGRNNVIVKARNLHASGPRIDTG